MCENLWVMISLENEIGEKRENLKIYHYWHNSIKEKEIF